MKKTLYYSSIIIGIGLLFFAVHFLSQVPNPDGIASRVTQVYFADHISPAHQAVIERFNSLHRGSIEVIPVNLPFSKFSTNERKELIARSLRSKSDRLDVFSVDYIWTQRFAKWSEPLDGYFSEAEKKNILSPTLQSCISDSVLVAMPLYIDIGMLYYRRDILKKLPHWAAVEKRLRQSMTWNEFLSLANQLSIPPEKFMVFQAKDYEGLICNYFEIIASIENDYFKGNTISINTPTARKALQLMVDLIYTKHLAPEIVTSFDENTSYQYMLDNDVAFVRGWSNFIESFRPTYRDSSKIQEIERAPLPHFEGMKPVSVYGGWNLMISKFSTKKEAAVEFVRYLQSDEAKKILFELGDYIPANNSVFLDSAYLALHPRLSFYHTLLQRGFHRPFLEDYTKKADIIAYYVHLALRRSMTVDDALKKAEEMITANQILIK